MAPGWTKFGSIEDAMDLPQTALVSKELCQVGRDTPFSTGLELRKWVMICC